MTTPIKQGELAAMVPHLRGDMRKWAELSSVGSPTTTVYADTAMLQRCRDAVEKKQTTKKPKQQKVSDDADVQGQSGAALESITDTNGSAEASADAGS